MQYANLYKAETLKSINRFVKDLGTAAKKRGFIIHNEDKMEMAHSFGKHGVKVAEGFDLHMIQICKPEKAAKSLSKNLERAILMPKFVMTFTKDGKTQIRFLSYGKDLIKILVDDPEFPDSLEETYKNIIAMIEEAK
ncbi:DUF302 domain-containing protein [Dissulfurispira thermophila]|uniref:DUF302 domain-containing protein n=2 Tax=root TaxID=1 RepID=A0A7G1H4Q7_9BACT|nr:DUF302 domain-containing protein [Dissulfurispira thermophila]BCB96737.1 DUF302 domain-containing protein [Dissulfurispira thermophila]